MDNSVCRVSKKKEFRSGLEVRDDAETGRAQAAQLPQWKTCLKR